MNSKYNSERCNTQTKITGGNGRLSVSYPQIQPITFLLELSTESDIGYIIAHSHLQKTGVRVD